MIYRDFQDIKLSNLVLGCMRLPVINKDDSNIDQNQVNDMVDYAIENGINYFDTAWGYHNGQSEIAMGKALSRYDRNKYYIATKFPGYDPKNFGKVEETFYKQLEKTQMEYFDFYLFHNICEINIEQYLDDEKYGTATFLKKMKEEGKIKHLGFSVHGTFETMKRFLDKYGDIIEFCQIQLNYIDYDFQDAKLKVDYLNKLSIPIWVMEPVRGGKLVNMKDSYLERLNKYRNISPVEWAFRFVQGTPGVTAILSGMSNMEQLKENIEIFKTDKPLNDNETKCILDIAKEITTENDVPCTACRYCTSKCPMELDIPNLISLYNDEVFTNGSFRAPMLINTFDENKRPSACLSCRACEEVCPQNIKISEVMKDFNDRLKKNPFF